MHSRFETAAGRRRFYLDVGLRKRPIGSGSNMATLMQSEREKLFIVLESLFGDIPAVVVGGVATRAYSPERKTQDIDILVEHERRAEAAGRLASLGWRRDGELYFPNSALGLSGTCFDSARGIDQGDLTRMLGLLGEAAVEQVVAVVARHYADPHGAEDVRRYAMLGKLEYWTPDDGD